MKSVRVVSMAVAGLVLSGVGLFAVWAPAASADPGPTLTCTDTACSVTFTAATALQSFTVPANVTELDAVVAGGAGGPFFYELGDHSNGGQTSAALHVTPGEVLSLVVGQAGSPHGAAVYGGGGAGGSANAGSGGGGSFVADASGLLLAAGGGAGASDGRYGGGNGAGAGQTAGSGGPGFDQSYGGSGASPTGPGDGGPSGGNAGTGPASISSFQTGGAGVAGAEDSGGGGGGGYYGGGGGGLYQGNTGTGGGGGTGYASSDSSLVSNVNAGFGTNAGPGFVTFTFTPPSTSVSLTSSANPSGFGQSVTFTAMVIPQSPGDGTPTGTVTFSDDNAVFAQAPLVGGLAAVSISNLEAGAASIIASYTAGDDSFLPSTSLPLSQQVDPGSTATTVAATPNPSVVGQPVTLTATVAVTQGVGTPTGTVEFFNGTTTLGTAPLSAGTAILPSAALGVGSDAVTARYLGDPDFTSSTSTILNQVVDPNATATTLSVTPNPGTLGTQVRVTATVAVIVPGAGTPTGSVEFFDGTTSLGPATLTAGVATLAISPDTVATHSLSAVYGGDANDLTSTSPAVSLVVDKAPTTTTLSSSAATIVAGASFTLTAVVDPPAAVPIGTVEFYDGNTPLGAARLDSTGTAHLTITAALSVGAHSLAAGYLGDPNFTASASLTVALVVDRAPSPAATTPPVATTPATPTTTTPTTNLADTGPDRAAPLTGAGLGLLTLGLVILISARHRRPS